MKLRLCPPLLLPLYLSLLPFLVTSAAPVTLNDVPGCACRAQDVCDGGPTGFAFDVAACVFAMRSSGPSMSSEEYSPYICNGLEANPEFCQAYGNESEPVFENFETTKGPYYWTGYLPAKIALGTCEDFYARQKSCPPLVLETNVGTSFYIDTPNEDDNTTNITELYHHSNAWGSVGPFGASGWSYLNLPTTNSELLVYTICKFFRVEDDPYATQITSGYEDSLKIYASFQEDASFDKLPSMGSKQEPVLTSEDWIEPLPGRRYMGYNFVDDSPEGTNYCLAFMLLRNKQCRGPSPTDELWIDPPSSSSVAPLVAHHQGLAWQLVFGLAAAAAVVVQLVWILYRNLDCKKFEYETL